MRETSIDMTIDGKQYNTENSILIGAVREKDNPYEEALYRSCAGHYYFLEDHLDDPDLPDTDDPHYAGNGIFVIPTKKRMAQRWAVDYLMDSIYSDGSGMTEIITVNNEALKSLTNGVPEY